MAGKTFTPSSQNTGGLTVISVCGSGGPGRQVGGPLGGGGGEGTGRG